MAERTLHPHQLTALKGLSRSLRTGHLRPILVAPTGFGKTEVMAAITKAYRGVDRAVLAVAPRISLIEQTGIASASMASSTLASFRRSITSLMRWLRFR